jgi:YHS domain-containing protein
MRAFILSLWLTIGSAALATEGPVNTNRMGVFIDGYDVVSYFEEGEAQRGSSDISLEWQGLALHFKSEKHRQLFSENPNAYLPQYAGHCANGLSDGHLVGANPEIFRIIDDRLYLFYSWWGKAQWKRNQQEQIELANQYWLEFSQSN